MKFQVTRLEEVASTNDEAKRLAHAGAAEGTVIVADRQTAGRGRLGRVWASPVGNLFLSVVLRPSIAPAAAPPLAPSMGVAVARAIEQVAPLATELKWPNDVKVGGKKVAGVLTESLVSGNTLSAVVVGIGINIGAELPAELAEIATTLSREAARNVRKSEIEEALLAQIAEVYARFLKKGFEGVRPDWEERDALNGQTVTIDAGGRQIRGIARGVGRDGALRVEESGKIVEIATGEVL
ncbi:MAG TPA: biotin--[acetyl-CoA-carboxylase] ligase [bacterium]|nr:biotin--[acetyl-CoA-carboxylase] ligase [bacterium]